MDYQLAIPTIMKRAAALSGGTMIASRTEGGIVHRYRYCDMIERAKRFAVALSALGVGPGDRVATLAWNHHWHLEAYFGVTAIGAVLHTLNVRMHAGDLAEIVEHAQDRVLVVDARLMHLVPPRCVTPSVKHVIVIGRAAVVSLDTLDYETLLRETEVVDFEYAVVNERDPAALCYTSGTTGQPKGVLYSHRAVVLQAMNWTMADTVGVRQRDTLLAVVPMFHINAWCLPFTAALVGAKIVLPDRYLDAESLLELVAIERVTLSAGVPTVWLSVLEALDRGSPADVSTLRTLVIGGAAVPRALVQGYKERYDVTVIQAWGMTETTALATLSALPAELEHAPIDEQYVWRTRQGLPMPLIELRARGEDGSLVPWNGIAVGELEVRGPAVATQYYNEPRTNDRFTDDHWFKTGDIVTIDSRGSIEIKDRSKDLIRSGGEWISSVALENALMGHPAVAEAAVIAVPHPTWGERPLAVVVLKAQRQASAEELRGHLAPDFAKWWLPENFEFVDAIPRTSTGKFLKSELRERYFRSNATAFADARRPDPYAAENS